MAESDEEVDVEDISDGEQISHLRDMAEEDQKDNWYVFTLVFLFHYLGSLEIRSLIKKIIIYSWCSHLFISIVHGL